MPHTRFGKLALAALIGLSATSLRAGTLRLEEAHVTPSTAVKIPAIEGEDLAFFAQLATHADETLHSVTTPLLTPEVLSANYPLAASPSAVQEVNFSPFGMMVATATPTVVPEPSTFILLGMGAVGVYAAARRRRQPARA
jgi:hypothetical protein